MLLVAGYALKPSENRFGPFLAAFVIAWLIQPISLEMLIGTHMGWFRSPQIRSSHIPSGRTVRQGERCGRWRAIAVAADSADQASALAGLERFGAHGVPCGEGLVSLGILEDVDAAHEAEPPNLADVRILGEAPEAGEELVGAGGE